MNWIIVALFSLILPKWRNIPEKQVSPIIVVCERQSHVESDEARLTIFWYTVYKNYCHLNWFNINWNGRINLPHKKWFWLMLMASNFLIGVSVPTSVESACSWISRHRSKWRGLLRSSLSRVYRPDSGRIASSCRAEGSICPGKFRSGNALTLSRDTI